MIVVIAQMQIKPDEREDALNIMNTYVQSCRELSGIISVTLTENVNQENTFIFIQEYDNEEATSAHDKSEIFGDFMGGMGVLLTDTPSVHTYTVSEKNKLM